MTAGRSTLPQASINPPPQLIPMLKTLRLGGTQDTPSLRMDQAQQQLTRNNQIDEDGQPRKDVCHQPRLSLTEDPPPSSK